MTLKASQGLRDKLMVTGSLKATMDLGFVKIYSGAVPVTASDALGAAVLLCTVSNASGATGVTFATTTASAGVAQKTAAEVWSGVNAVSGTASFYRHVAPADDGTLSTTQARLQGLVAVSGAELNLSSVALVAAATQTIDFYNVALPTL